MDILRDDWKVQGARITVERWQGETWFFLDGKAPAEAPARRSRRVSKKGKLWAEELDPKTLAGLRTGAGIDRVGLVTSLDVI